MIYCLEDDSSVRDLMLYTLTAANLEAKGFDNNKSFWNALKVETPDLIMLDIMLPDEDGISILKKLKKDSKTADIPVIMSTAKGTEYDKVLGLDLGADDYLVKPFGMMEMVSHIKAVLRRVKKGVNDTISVSRLTLDNLKHIVLVDNEVVNLTLKEYELLHLLMANVDMVFTRDQLLEKIWGIDFIGETRTVDVHIGTLRSKLKSCGDYIETVRGVGYKMRSYI